MKTDLIVLRSMLLQYRPRLVAEALIALSVIVCLSWYDAPSWAYALAVYIGTRPSRLDSAADTSALQSTYHVRLKAIEDTADRIIARLDRWKMGPGA